MRTRRTSQVLTAALLVGLSSTCSPERDFPVTRLSDDLRPLELEFNKDVGKVRLLLLLDPT